LPEAQSVPGYHQVLGPVVTTPGSPAVLLERDSVAPYVRVVPAAAKVPEDQVVPTVLDSRFPFESIVLYPDSVAITPEPIRGGQVPLPVAVHPKLAEWAPGSMRIQLEGSAPKPTYLLIAENWYSDWHATVDGKPVPVRRGDHTLLSVVLPSGAREVRLTFASAAYARGKLITWLALLISGALLAAPLWIRRRSAAHG
jgi:hypothetical protein